jgi:hypothetical protein
MKQVVKWMQYSGTDIFGMHINQEMKMVRHQAVGDDIDIFRVEIFPQLMQKI